MNGVTKMRVDLQLVAGLVAKGSRVLDVGCGDSALLAHLAATKAVDARGIELSMAGVRGAVSQGLSVIQGDADTDLAGYPDNAFDYVILSKTLQATRDPRGVLTNLLRIGRRAIVSFPNFAYWRNRWQIAIGGRMPMHEALSYAWWETPNIHFCTISDFIALCDREGYVLEAAYPLDANGRVMAAPIRSYRANLLAADAVFLLGRDGDARP